MPTIIGTYAVTVPGDLAGWTVGPIFQAGESVRVQASGAIEWATVEGDTVLTSSPSTFSTPSGAGSTSAGFVIPAGVYTSAIWEIKGTHSLGVSLDVSIATDSDSLGASAGSSPFDLTAAATSNQLADINAAAGEGLVVSVSSGGNPASISSFTLTLGTGTAGYALPEGAYPPSYPSSHSYNPSSVLQNAAWTGSALVVANTVPVSLAAIVLPDGVSPAFESGYSGLRPNEDTTYQASDLAAAGATHPEAVYRLWFIFNDWRR